MVENIWDNNKNTLKKSELDVLVYRSNLLGSDRSIANIGGGNTSTKTTMKNFKGEEIDVMWVKGSGSDLATMRDKDFTALRLDDISILKNRAEMMDEEMVEYLTNCMMNFNYPRPSIETLLHAFLPYRHIDHTHPDAIISLACADNGQEIAKEIFGETFVWIPYVRPGFLLSKMIAEKVEDNPQAKLVIMEKHGLVTWGETSKASYDQTISVINQAEEYILSKSNNYKPFGGKQFDSISESSRNEILTEILPVIRGEVSEEQKTIITYDDSESTMEFINSQNAERMSQIGAACPDHLVHTKRIPLYVKWNPITSNLSNLKEQLKKEISSFKVEYKKYFEKYKNTDDKMFEPEPRVILIPGVGMVNTGKSITAANISKSLYQRAIEVMKGATFLGNFVSLDEKESFEVEYWPLELYKLSLTPPEDEFSRKVAYITGGAGGIGAATGRRLASEGAHVILADINLEGARNIAEEINISHGEERATAVYLDVTNEKEVIQSIKESILFCGGIDIIVNNAGLASSSSLEDTTLNNWRKNIDVLVTGYFLVAREGFKLMKKQQTGGNMVFVGSKNSVYAGKNVAAYSTAKAAEVHLARTIAVDGGEYGIRVNSVLPDAVIRGSQIWDSEWKEERAQSYGIEPNQLEEHYRKRTILNVNILPEDIAETIAFIASSRSSKTTGCMIPVDGGVSASFTR